MSAAMEKQHTLTLTAEVHARQNPIGDGEFNLCPDHHRTLPTTRRYAQPHFSPAISRVLLLGECRQFAPLGQR